ncbi:MAG TPA: hypothetical protein PKM97_05645 [Bacteroidia bacterium]|nr:hypothetical protein [Bacteroidia bacterium]
MKKVLLILTLTCLFFSCNTEKEVEYEVDPVSVTQGGGNKNNQKSTTEFISIAYADLFGTEISQARLVNLSIAYSSFGDLRVIEDRIIRNFLNDSTAIIPSTPSVNGDTILFINNSYKKFFNREATEFEKYQWLSMIRSSTVAGPLTVYYSLMTSDEYRFY